MHDAQPYQNVRRGGEIGGQRRTEALGWEQRVTDAATAPLIATSTVPRIDSAASHVRMPWPRIDQGRPPPA